MNLILNSRFTIAQRGTSFNPSAGSWTVDRWRSATNGYSLNGGTVTLTANGTVGIVQPIESYDASIGETLAYGVTSTALSGSPTVTSSLLGWTGTADKPTNPGLSGALSANWQVISGAVPSGVNNLALLIEISGNSGDSVKLDKAYVGDDEHRRYRDDLAACSLFYQKLDTKWHANEQIFWGRTISATQAHMELPLPFPIRGRDGSYGVNDVSVSWGGITFNTTAADGNMWLYAGGVARRVSTAPVLTCVHRQNPGLGFTFTCSQGGLPAANSVVGRTYYASQAAIDNAVSTDFFEVDAELHE